MSRRKVNKRNIALLVADRNCNVCHQPLTADNAAPHRVAVYDYVCTPCQREREKKKDIIFKSAVMKEYGGKCICCGESNIVFLTIDHIDGSGAKDFW
jgi:ssDNA-binding Zn-finger/Zn-ribbon topoisomerase 1